MRPCMHIVNFHFISKSKSQLKQQDKEVWITEHRADHRKERTEAEKCFSLRILASYLTISEACTFWKNGLFGVWTLVSLMTHAHDTIYYTHAFLLCYHLVLTIGWISIYSFYNQARGVDIHCLLTHVLHELDIKLYWLALRRHCN